MTTEHDADLAQYDRVGYAYMQARKYMDAAKAGDKYATDLAIVWQKRARRFFRYDHPDIVFGKE